MKYVGQLEAEYIEEHPNEFETTSTGTVVPKDFDITVLKHWLNEPSSAWLAETLKGCTKADVCKHAEALLKFFSGGNGAEFFQRIADCINAFADWETDRTVGPEVVLSYCEWMRHELILRWREPNIFWPLAALHLVVCELGIRAYHRLDTRDPERKLLTLLLNASHYFEVESNADREKLRQNGSN